MRRRRTRGCSSSQSAAAPSCAGRVLARTRYTSNALAPPPPALRRPHLLALIATLVLDRPSRHPWPPPPRPNPSSPSKTSAQPTAAHSSTASPRAPAQASSAASSRPSSSSRAATSASCPASSPAPSSVTSSRKSRSRCTSPSTAPRTPPSARTSPPPRSRRAGARAGWAGWRGSRIGMRRRGGTTERVRAEGRGHLLA